LQIAQDILLNRKILCITVMLQLMGCDVMQSGRSLTTMQTDILYYEWSRSLRSGDNHQPENTASSLELFSL